jgi:hypothetical protein
MNGLLVETSDGIGFYRGTVSDISLSGIRIIDNQPRIDENGSWLIANITGHGSSFRMLIKPVWSILEGTSRSIGGAIVDTSWDWPGFVRRFELETNKKIVEIRAVTKDLHESIVRMLSTDNSKRIGKVEKD